MPMAVASPCERILVMDDNADMVESLRDVLELQGADVATALSPADADRVLAGGFNPSVFLLDLRLGPNESGAEYVRRLRAEPRYQSIPIVAMSGDPVGLRRLDAVDRKLMKPFHLEHLLEALEELCRGA